MRLAHARKRMAAYLARHGGRATISRKTGAAWTVVAADVPLISESRSRQADIDPMRASPDEAQFTHLSLPFGTDIRPGDRVVLTLPDGRAPGTLTVASVEHNSLDVATQADAAIEQSAVETYRVTIERWEDATGSYVPVLAADAAILVEPFGVIQTREHGTSGAGRTGTLVFDPAPDAAIGVGDWITGIPWARAATVSLVRPVVGDRLEVEFRFDSGGAA